MLKATTGKDECDLDEAGASDCLSLSGYTVKTSKYVTVSEVYVAELETLRDRFESYEGKGLSQDTSGAGNTIKFNKRRRKGTHAFANSTTLSSGSSGSSANGDTTHSDGDNDNNINTHVANLEYNELVSDSEIVLVDTVRKPGMQSISRAFHRAGPRKSLHFNPSQVNAAIVTCGGLCPGLNNVIRELTHSLYFLYGAKNVYGIQGGFHGFHDPLYPPIRLTNDLVSDIHHSGGTVLRSSRGGFDIEKIMTFLEENEINQLYIIGGDGTHRGAYAIHEACVEANMNIACVGIPKTIDNDVDYIDRSFGFQSAVEAAQAAIRTAKTEAMCNVPNGIGICKLMGRSAGFLAAFAALGSGDVDLVLIPEVPIDLDLILPFLRKRVQEQKYAVVVVAEGAGEELLGKSEVVDAGGNRALPEIGPFLQKATRDYFSKFGEEATIKYVDPSYTVRSVPANGADSLYCQELAMDAVHGCMAGFTGFSAGIVNRSPVYIPIPQLVATSPRNLDPNGRTWSSILAMTGQPNTAKPKPKKESTESSSSTEDISLPQFDTREPTAH